MPGQIDRVRNDGGCGVSLGCGPRQNGDGVGNAERETASVTSAGCNPSRRVIGMNDRGSHQARRVGPIGKTEREMLCIIEMQRDVAAIIDVSPRELSVF